MSRPRVKIVQSSMEWTGSTSAICEGNIKLVIPLHAF